LPQLRIGHPFAAQSPHHQGLEALKARLAAEHVAHVDLLEKSSVSTRNGSLVQAVRSGSLHMAVVPLGELARLAPRFSAFDMPFLFRDERHVLAVESSEIGERLLNDVRSAGLECAGWWPGDFLVLASSKPILEPEDLEALDWNAPDAIETSLADVPALGSKYRAITLTHHIYKGYVVVANRASWNRLSGRAREAIRQAIRTQHESLRRRIAEVRQNVQTTLARDQAYSIFSLTLSQRQQWRQFLETEHRYGLRTPDYSGQAYLEPIDPDLIHEIQGFHLAAAKDGGREGPSLSWNSWLEDNQGRDAAALAAGNVYRINLDLARYAYRATLSRLASARLEKKLREQGELKLLLQPVLIGTTLAPAPGRPLGPQLLTVKLDRLKLGADDAKLLEAFDAGTISTRTLSDAVNLGAIASWEVKAQEIGCGSFAISIWDDARVTPLDHVVVAFPVREQNSGPKECAVAGSQAMGSGLETLLSAQADMTAGARQADAALHVFETKDDGKRRSIAVFVDRARLAAAHGSPNASDQGVYAWELASVLSTYVSDPSQLPDLIKSAHTALTQPDKRPHPFEDVAQELALKVFSGATARDTAEANKAEAALRQLVASVESPVVLVRLVSADGYAMFIPFGLLAAQAQEPILPKRFTLIQPMAARGGGDAACISAWHVARPRELQGVSGEARDLLADAAARPLGDGMELLADHASLARYFNDTSAPADARGGEGLIVLAHHNKGYLKFSDKDRPPARIPREFISRSFPPGSVAILAACSTSGESPETRALVEQLERRGIETMILSPFAVDAEFGTRLALEFERVVTEERARKSGATLLEVFDRTVQRVASAFKNEAAFRDMALEFQLVGNADLRLCK